MNLLHNIEDRPEQVNAVFAALVEFGQQIDEDAIDAKTKSTELF